MTRVVLLPIAFIQPVVLALSARNGADAALTAGSPSEPDAAELRTGNGAGATR
jgi:hypothetical protein